LSNSKALKDFVKQRMLPLDGTAHSYAHTDRVVRVAAILAEKERADAEVVQTGALLHDIGRVVGEPHNETGASLAGDILKRYAHYPQEKTEKIVKIIIHHPIAFRSKLESLEERIVWDADKIDLLGVIGIARVFHWLGKNPFETAVTTCFEELKPIYRSLNTISARKIAKERYQRTIACLSALNKELSTTDLKAS
jgi:uncharacterized protein